MYLKKLPHLKWKCFDDFDSVKNSDLFFDANISITEDTRNTLRPIFKQIAETISSEIYKEFHWKSEHAIFTGGNHTFYFILPRVFNFMRNRYKFTSVYLKLEETAPTQDYIAGMTGMQTIEAQDYDLMIGGYYLSHPVEEKFESDKYFLSKTFFDDRMYFASSKAAIEEFGSNENVLKFHEIVFGRRANLVGDDDIIMTSPEERKDESPRLVIDSHYMAYAMMKENVGIWHIFDSSHDKDVIILEKNPNEILRRLILIKKNKEYKDVKKQLFKYMKNEM